MSSLGYIAPSEVVVLGGSGAIPASVEASLVQLSATSISLSFTVKRLSGADRYATAAAVSADTYASAPVVLVATGDNFPDALAGSSLSGFYGAPILLVAQDRIPSATAAELTRLKPSQIVILGGSGAVSSRVESQLAAFVTR